MTLRREDWLRVKHVFDGALTRDPGAWDAFVANACGGDEALRRQVEALLAAHQRAANFLESPASQVLDLPLITEEEVPDSVEPSVAYAGEGFFEKPAAVPPCGEASPVAGSPQGHPAQPDDGPGLSVRITGGRFAIEAPLGEGAFGAIYRARDLESHAVVALKMLKVPHPDVLYHFKREFRALSDLSHPNLARLYELFNHEGVWFFSMEYIDGVDFRRWVEEGQAHEGTTDPSWKPRTPENALAAALEEPVSVRAAAGPRFRLNESRLRDALRQLTIGVRALHRAGRLHRDLKPSNVMVTREGRVVVLDVGLITDGEPLGSSQTTGFAGTPVYMSPEQASGKPTTEKSDWYSVGAMLFEVLTGQPPYRGDPVDRIGAEPRVRPPDPRILNPTAPADLADLALSLLSPDPAERPGAEEIWARLGTDAPLEPGDDAAPGDVFVGRTEELEILERAFERTGQGLSVVYVHGTSGIGKTALVEHFLLDLRRRVPGVVVLKGRCYAEEQVPFKAFDGLVDALSRFLGSDGEATQFLPRDVPMLARIFPVLRRARAVLEARRRVAEPADAQELRRRAFEALRELLSRVASQRPLVAFVDDLHWGDVDSLDIFRTLVRPPDPPPLLLIASYRSEEAGTSPLLRPLLALAGPVREHLRGENWCEVQVRPLEQEEAQRLAAVQLGGDLANAAVVARESAGSPFFIRQIAAAYRDRGAQFTDLTLAGALQTRLARLSKSERRVLSVVAVAGQPIERAVAVKAAALTDEQGDAASMLQKADLIRFRASDESYQLEVYHDRIRESAVDSLSSEERRDLHHGIAEALQSRGAADPEQLLVHLEAAGERERAAACAVDAAKQASEKLAFQRAARLYRVALDLGRPAGDAKRALQESLADSLAKAGNGAGAAAVFLAAAEGAPPADGVELRRRAAEQLLISGHFAEGKEVLADVLAQCGLKLAGTRRRALASLLARRAYLRVRGFAFRPRALREVRADELLRVDTSWSASHTLTVLDYIHGADYGARHLLLALRAGEPRRVARAVALEVAHVGVTGVPTARRVVAVRRLAERLVARADDPYLSGLMRLATGIVAFCHGRRSEGRDLCDEAVVMLRQHAPGAWWETTTAQSVATWSRFWLGDYAHLSLRVPALLEDARGRGDLYSSTSLASTVANVAWLVRDDLEGARRELRRAREQWSAEGFQFQDYWLLQGDILLELYAGNGETARRRLEASWKSLEGTLLLRVQYLRVEMLYLRAAAALASAVTPGVDAVTRASCLATARHCARRLAREAAFPGASGLTAFVRAALATTHGDDEAAVQHLAAAEEEFAGASFRMYAAAMRWRRGKLLGGDEGIRLTSIAEAAMVAENVTNPARMTAMLAPGFPG